MDEECISPIAKKAKLRKEARVGSGINGRTMCDLYEYFEDKRRENQRKYSQQKVWDRNDIKQSFTVVQISKIYLYMPRSKTEEPYGREDPSVHMDDYKFLVPNCTISAELRSQLEKVHCKVIFDIKHIKARELDLCKTGSHDIIPKPEYVKTEHEASYVGWKHPDSDDFTIQHIFDNYLNEWIKQGYHRWISHDDPMMHFTLARRDNSEDKKKEHDGDDKISISITNWCHFTLQFIDKQ